jgi:hypothetical protein
VAVLKDFFGNISAAKKLGLSTRLHVSSHLTTPPAYNGTKVNVIIVTQAAPTAEKHKQSTRSTKGRKGTYIIAPVWQIFSF